MSVQSWGPHGDAGDPDRGARRGPAGAAGRVAPGRRWIHRRGVLFRAELRPPFAASQPSTRRPGSRDGAGAAEPLAPAPSPGPAGPAGPAMVESPAPGSEPGVRPALVRLSSTFGWPAPLPDWCGMGVRLLDAEGHHDRDLLLVSSAPAHELWCQMRPGRHPLACTFTSVFRHRLGDVDQVVAAVPAAPRQVTLAHLAGGAQGDVVDGQALCPVVYRLMAAQERRAWRPLGDLVLTERIEDDPTVRFWPSHVGSRLLVGLRQRFYACSRS